MKSMKAIFLKQMKDTFKNRVILIQFFIFPMIAFVMTEMVAKASDEIPNNMFVTMFAAMFVGMTPLITTAAAIAEDRERKSLRFLVMAGVKQHEYLLGVGGFILIVCLIISLLFGLIGGFAGMEFVQFFLILVLGAIASILLGAAIGIFSKNQQQATAISVPLFMLFSFCPMIAQFNETVEKIANIFYTQQINIVVNDFSVSAVKPILIILTNMMIFFCFFALAYKRKGLQG